MRLFLLIKNKMPLKPSIEVHKYGNWTNRPGEKSDLTIVDMHSYGGLGSLQKYWLPEARKNYDAETLQKYFSIEPDGGIDLFIDALVPAVLRQRNDVRIKVIQVLEISENNNRPL